MSTVRESSGAPASSAPADDPYRFGWRMVKQTGPDGALTWEQVPLTQEDVLHPEEEDFIVHNGAHDLNCFYLKGALLDAVASEQGTQVNHDVRTDWGVEGIRPHGPDLTVFRGLTQPWDIHRGTFMVAELGAQPALVIEVTSPSTRAHDLDQKVLQYHQAGVPFYAIVDYCPELQPPHVRVIGYRSTPEGYVRVLPNDRGWVWLEPVRLWLAGEGDFAVCYDEQGERIPDYAELARQVRDADAHAEELANLTEEAVRARKDAEAQAAQATLAKQQAEAQAAQAARDKQQAEEQAAQAARDKQQAEANAKDLALRLQEMEAELRRLRGAP